MTGPAGTRIQVLGLCRFSVPFTGGFQVVHATPEARRAHLYAPDRLAERFLWFEHLLLPSLRAQTDRDFRLILLCGDDLPEPWRGRLLDLVAATPQVTPTFRASDNHRALCRRVMAEAADPRAGAIAEFRLDDDDAVAGDYVARVRTDFDDHIAPLMRRFGRAFGDHTRGAVLDTVGRYALRRVIAPHLTAGLTLYFPPDTQEHVLDFAHHRILEHMPGVGFQDEIMYLRGRHGRNDSDTWGGKLGPAHDAAAAADIAARRFGIDLPRFALELADLRAATAARTGAKGGPAAS